MNKHARSITKWTTARDKRLARLISYIHHTSEFKQCCHVGNTAQQCRLRLFQDSDFAGDPEESKSTSGGILCIFGSLTFAPMSWMCKKQTSVSHKTCAKRLARLISYIHHTSEYRQYCYVCNTAQHCRLGLFQDSDFACDLEDSKSTSGEVLCPKVISRAMSGIIFFICSTSAISAIFAAPKKSV